MSEQPPRASSQVPLPGETPEHEPEIAAGPLPVEHPEERIRARAGEALDRTADAARRIGHRAREQGGIVGQAEPLAYRVGDSLQSAASYVRTNDLREMRGDVEYGVHRSPLKALAFAALGGFLLGRLFR